MTTKIGILGITGRMGKLIAAEVILSTEPCCMSAAYARPGQACVGQDVGCYLGLGAQDVFITDTLLNVFSRSDVVIDFTGREGISSHLQGAVKAQKPLIIGTTGLTNKEEQDVGLFSQKIPIVYTSNMTLGIALLHSLVQKAAQVLGTDFDVEIGEMHHRHKKDAPSGTSLSLGKAIAHARHASFQEVAVFDRTSKPSIRQEGEIGFSVMRGGNVFGDHSVVFASDHEVITFSHHSIDRAVFAKGAVKAAIWLHGKPSGLYDMQDVLGLKE
jgi:4-hydroxy-tetrahydrodipicolinate reductase